MPQVPLGSSGLLVSRLAFGTVYLGPQGDNLPPGEGAALLLGALEQGVSFWDTSDDYGSHPHVADALRQVPRHRVTIASKAREPSGAVERILGELGTEYLDILFVHEVTLAGIEAAQEALRLWRPAESQGLVRALGFTTHSARVAWLAASRPEVDVLMLPINPTGVCTPGSYIEDGGPREMLQAAQRAWELGKGVVAMKVMGCGTLAADPEAAIAFAARLPWVHSLCIGMRSLQQVEENLRLLGRAGSQADSGPGRPCCGPVTGRGGPATADHTGATGP